MIVVSDSSPLIALASIGRLDLLDRYCGQVSIPPAVFSEIVTQGAGRSGAENVRRAAWIRTVALEDPAQLGEVDAIRVNRPGLGMGEIEAVVLARALSADWVLVDDARARRLAADRGLNPLGTIGLLVAFHRIGWIVDPAADAERLADQGFRVSRALLDDLKRRFPP